MKLTLAFLLSFVAVANAALEHQKACPKDRRLSELGPFVRRMDHLSPPTTTALIDNGVVYLGVMESGALGVSGPTSGNGQSVVGLRYARDGTTYDVITPGCDCEGWGASATGTGGSFFAYAGKEDGIVNLTSEPIVSDGTSATTVATVGSSLKVSHVYKPSTETSALYEVEVTYENLSTASLTDIRYRRAMDWDVNPTEYSECVTIDVGNSAALEFASDDGFADLSPLAYATQRNFACPLGAGCPVFDK